MQVTQRIHALKIPFTVPVSPERSLARFAFVYLVFGDKIHLIDSGVAGAAQAVWAYIREQGRDPGEVASLVLTHAHPDHLGGASRMSKATGCRVYAHGLEQQWIEDTDEQGRQRPVPGFDTLVEGPVRVDHLLADGDILRLERDLACTVIHTPGHSKGSISLWFGGEKTLVTGDALIFPGDLPIYEDIFACQASINRLQQWAGVETLLSSWEAPLTGHEPIRQRLAASLAYLERIHDAVLRGVPAHGPAMNRAFCQEVVAGLGLPPFAAMPLVCTALASSLGKVIAPGGKPGGEAG